MTRERLLLLDWEFLAEIARREGLRYDEKVTKDDLVSSILEAMEEDRLERETTNNLIMKVKEKKFQILRDEELFLAETDDYNLPEVYNETKIVLMLRDPLWAFAYWSLNDTELENIENDYAYEELVLRVYEMDHNQKLPKKSDPYFDIPVKTSDLSWYINLPQVGRGYLIDLVYINGDAERILCRSNDVQSPGMPLERETLQSPSEDELILSGLYDVYRNTDEKKIPQRIISMLDNQYLNLLKPE